MRVGQKPMLYLVKNGSELNLKFLKISFLEQRLLRLSGIFECCFLSDISGIRLPINSRAWKNPAKNRAMH